MLGSQGLAVLRPCPVRSGLTGEGSGLDAFTYSLFFCPQGNQVSLGTHWAGSIFDSGFKRHTELGSSYVSAIY